MSFMDILYVPLGFIMKFCCMISGNYYVLALFFFALILQILLFPLGIKQQKAQVTMAKLRPKEMAIRNKYAGRNDNPTMQKMNMEIQDLYSKEGYNPLSGCLPLLIQFPIIIALFAVVRSPITYTVNLGSKEKIDINGLYREAVEMIEESKNVLKDYEKSDKSEEEKKHISNYLENQKNLQKVFGATLKDNGEWDREKPLTVKDNGSTEYSLVQMIVEGNEKINKVLGDWGYAPVKDTFDDEIKEKMPNFTILPGITALETPRFGFNWLMLIPILVFVSSYFSTILIKKLSSAGPDVPGAPGNGLFMKVGMPLMSAVFTFTFPAAIGVYWIFRTVMGVVQQFVMSKIYPLPKFTEEEMAAAQKEYKKEVKKAKKVIMIEVDEDDNSYDALQVDEKGNKVAETKNGKIEMLTIDGDYENEKKEDNKEENKSDKDGEKPGKSAGALKEDNPPPEKKHKE